MSVIWHDLECGGYLADLPVWRGLAERFGDPILDVGAGTGRVSLDLARHGHTVVALDLDPLLLAELAHRADSLPVRTVAADAREFSLEQRFALVLGPMQTVQLLGGADQRTRFLTRARDHLRPGGLIALAIAESIQAFEAPDSTLGPLPDVLERDGSVYFSSPTAIREDDRGFVLERRRELVTAAGERTVQEDHIRLDRVSADDIESEAASVGLVAAGRQVIDPTEEHVGSTVVMLGG